ncbi:hypothetical protein JJE00_07270 [Candidatus Bathyarchaeota archaeon]|nr:hypothetical protein [Candidatus Bathyarchaeota archaeon]
MYYCCTGYAKHYFSSIFSVNICGKGELAKKVISDVLIVELKKQGFSNDAIKELVKWYDSSEHKGVASF